MPRLTPHLLVIPLAVGIGLGIASLDPEKVNGRTTESELSTNPALHERLAQNDAIVKYKDYLVRELLNGRMTLAEVADEFLRVNADQPQVLESILRKYPGSSEREKSAHNVLAFACARCLTPAEAEEVLARLATEFAVAFGHQPADVTT
jgi:hypothetical protein